MAEKDKAKSKPAQSTKAADAKQGVKSAPIPGKHEDHPGVMAGRPAALGADAVPGTQKEDWEVKPGVFEDHPAVIAGEPANLGTKSVPGSKAKDWDVKPDKHEDHPLSQDAPALGEDAVPGFEMDDDSDARPSATNKLRLVGLKNQGSGRIPSAISLIMPDKKGRDQEKAGRPVTSGRTLTVASGEFRGFTDKETEWLMDHPVFEFEKA